MHRNVLGAAAALVVRAGVLAAQQPTLVPDSSALAAAERAGTADGARASVRRPRWASAAATVLWTPLVGGVGALVLASRPPRDVPRTVPPLLGAPADSASARYRAAYRAAYALRRRNAVRQAVLVGSGVFAILAGAAALAY